MRTVLAITAAALVTLTGCGTDTDTTEASPASTTATSSDPTSTTAATGPIIEPFGTPLVGADRKTVTIESARAEGEQTTIALRYRAGDEAIETYNILTPTLNYGPDGTTAEVVKLPDVSGVIVPGQSKVITYPFDVAASELSEATLTIMVGLGSASWTGDLEAYIAESSSAGASTEPMAAPAPAASTTPAVSAAPAATVAPPVVGFTEAPGHGSPTPMNKSISSCGDPAMHQPGTTFFTDGTSGWTQTCADQMG